jgi:flavodoxin
MTDKTMILYFTGTGNSRYVAEKIADETKSELLNLSDRIKKNETFAVQADNVVFVTPTYAWRIPRIVRDWIRKADFSAVKKVWFVMTCGSEIGNASAYNQKLCSEKGCEHMGTAQIIMPENYIAMFDVPGNSVCGNISTYQAPGLPDDIWACLYFFRRIQ